MKYNSLQQAVLDVMLEKKIKHPNQQVLDVHEPEKDELTAKDFEMLRKGKKADMKEAMSPQAATTMKHVKNPTAGEKQAAKDIKPGVAGYRDRIAMLKSAEARGGLKKEEVEQTDEAVSPHDDLADRRRITPFNKTAAGKAREYARGTARLKGQMQFAKSQGGVAGPKGKLPEEVEQFDEEPKVTVLPPGPSPKGSWGKGLAKSKYAPEDKPKTTRSDDSYTNYSMRQGEMGNPIKRAGIQQGYRKMRGEEVEQEDYQETLIFHDSFNIELAEDYTFGDYLTAAKKLVGEEEAIDLANQAFKDQDLSIFVEGFSRASIEDKINAHMKAGHKVSMPKYSTRDGKPHAEYVVTDKETGVRRKIIHQGNVVRSENMGAKGKKE